MTSATARPRRLYFALWPSAEIREQIATIAHDWIARSGGVAIRPENFHVTLAFLGSVSADSLQRIMEAAASLSAEPFEFSVDRIETWMAANVLCLVAAQPEPALLALAASLRFNLLERRVESAPEEFRPHVTLARRRSSQLSQRIDAAIGPVIWPVRDLVLVESTPGAHGSEYEILERWSLRHLTVKIYR